MSRLYGSLAVRSLVGLLALLLGAQTVYAYPRGLIRAADFSQIYWVDRFGVSHLVPSTAMIPIYFPNDVIKEVAWNDWLKLPKGGPITAMNPPEFYDTATTKITMKTKTTYSPVETELGAAPIVTKTESLKVPPGVKLETATGAAPIGTGNLDMTDELAPGAVKKEVVTTKTAAGVVQKKTETITQQPLIEKTTQIATPDVTQSRTEYVTPAQVSSQVTIQPAKVLEQTVIKPGLLQKRVETTMGAAPILEQKVQTTTTAAGLIEKRIETSYGAAPVVEKRIETSYGAAPLVEKRIETSYGAAPIVEQRTETSYGAAPVVEQRTELLAPVVLEKKTELLEPAVIQQETQLEY